MFKTMLNVNKINYVEVMDEPIHKEIFKNEYIRVYTAEIKPGEQTLYHRHCENTVYVVIQGGTIGTRIAGNSRRYPMDFPKSFSFLTKIRWGIRNLLTGSITIPQGLFFCMLHKDLPVIHRAHASNKNLKNMILMGIEILKKSVHGNVISIFEDYYINDYESYTFNVYRVKLKPGESTGYHTYGIPTLVIALKGACCINTEGIDSIASLCTNMVCGEFRWRDDKTALSISNIDNESFEGIVIALK